MPNFEGELAIAAKGFLDERDSGDTGQINKVIENVRNSLEFMAEYAVQKFLSKNDIDFATLQKEASSVYIIISPEKAAIAKRVLRIIYTQILNQQYKRDGDKMVENQEKKKHQLLLVMDEMNQLGYFELLKNSVSLLRGYGVRLMMIARMRVNLRRTTRKHTWNFLRTQRASI